MLSVIHIIFTDNYTFAYRIKVNNISINSLLWNGHSTDDRISALEKKKRDTNFTVRLSTHGGSIKCYRFRNNYVFCVR